MAEKIELADSKKHDDKKRWESWWSKIKQLVKEDEADGDEMVRKLMLTKW